jgi:cysteine synthase B
MIGAAIGYPVTLVLPDNVSWERKRTITAYGAQMVFSSGLEGSDGAIRLCRELLANEPQKYFKPDQYFNPANPQAHYEGTGPEIWTATGGGITHFVASIGTGGTIMGAGRYLKERNPKIKVIAAEPDDALHGLEGLKHMASSIVPGVYHENELDWKVPIPTDDAYDLVYALGSLGLVVGQSSGAALYAARKVAREIDEGVIVAIFPDFGDRYLSTNLWMGWDDWQRKRRAAQSGR